MSFLVAGSILAKGEFEQCRFLQQGAIFVKVVVSLFVAGAISFCKAGAIIAISQARRTSAEPVQKTKRTGLFPQPREFRIFFFDPILSLSPE